MESGFTVRRDPVENFLVGLDAATGGDLAAKECRNNHVYINILESWAYFKNSSAVWTVTPSMKSFSEKFIISTVILQATKFSTACLQPHAGGPCETIKQIKKALKIQSENADINNGIFG